VRGPIWAVGYREVERRRDTGFDRVLFEPKWIRKIGSFWIPLSQ
jgi:hypothetical protein